MRSNDSLIIRMTGKDAANPYAHLLQKGFQGHALAIDVVVADDVYIVRPHFRSFTLTESGHLKGIHKRPCARLPDCLF